MQTHDPVLAGELLTRCAARRGAYDRDSSRFHDEILRVKSPVRLGVALTLLAACLGGPAGAGPVGTAETFESYAAGSFPAGWNDVALIDPASTAPKPSALVVSTTDAFGNPTKAMSTLPKVLGVLPATGPTQGIYRAIAPAGFYSTSADVRIDRFSDVTNFDCGCPPEAIASSDWPLSIGFSQLSGTVDPAKLATVTLLASSRTHDWRLLVLTANVVGEVNLGVTATLGNWYRVQLDLDAAGGTAHSRIIDILTGATLVDAVSSLTPAWNPAVDGQFDIAGYFGGELTALTTSGLATVDNIDAHTALLPEPGTILLFSSALAAGAVVRKRKQVRLTAA